MLQSKSNWKYPKIEETSLSWMEELTDLSPITKKLLLQRGIKTLEEATRFLSPDIRNLHSPELIDSISQAKERVYQAIQQKERILIFGDYDADGISSTTVLLKALKELGADCDFYIPNRFTEGYGPNEEAFINAHENGFTLIITVDTGISAVYEAFVAKELGIDLIITDHHEMQDELPDAYAIIHPKCSPNYPFKELAGVGVAFKFAESLLGYFPKHLLEFVAIGTIADLVPLIDENRVLSFFGLHALTISKNVGIQALKEVSQIEGNVTEEDVGFLIGPRLNAVGRLQDADLAVELLMSENLNDARRMAKEIQHINEQRQQIVNEIVIEAEELVENYDGVIVAAKEGWNEGVLGIVASKLVRKYDRPAIVLSLKPDVGEAKGSARSIPAFDLFQNCMKMKELFVNFGGHSQAAGMTLPIENIGVLQEQLSKLMHEQLSEEDFKQEIEISSKLELSDINLELIHEVSRLAPFGMNNPKPVFEITEVPIEIRQIGSTKKHLKFQFRKEGTQLDGIGFGFGDLYPFISSNTEVTLAGELSVNEWNGMKKAQIMIADMKIDSWQLFDYRGKRNMSIKPIPNHTILVISNGDNEYHPSILHRHYNEYDYPEEVDILYICDLPPTLKDLKKIIEDTNPKMIYVNYKIEDSAYLTSFPTREEFIWFYALIKKRANIDLKRELKAIMNMKGWSKDRIIFISQVFLDLGFVSIENGVITYNSNPMKRELTDSPTYQERLNRIQVEKTLYYSNYEELRNWISSCKKDQGIAKEEVVNGL